MKRGHLYRVFKGTSGDPRKYRVFVVVSRQVLLDSRFSTALCAFEVLMNPKNPGSLWPGFFFQWLRVGSAFSAAINISGRRK